MAKTSPEPKIDAASPEPAGGRPAAKRAPGRSPEKAGKGSGKPAKDAAAPAAPGRKPARKKKARLPARKTFMVAATLSEGERGDLRVYAAVTRSAAEALAAVRTELGPEIAVELTGKLSNRMAKTLGLKADEIRQI